MPHSLSHGKPLDVGAYGFDASNLPPMDQGPIDLKGWFGPDRAALPLELEIGSGKCTFLLQQGQATPQVNYIGLEYARAFWRYGADRVRRHALPNVRVGNVEASIFLRYYVPASSLRQIHVYFPDPWPKARHHKRRLIQEPTLRLFHRALEPAGRVRLVTDHADYFQWMLEHIAKVPDLFEQAGFDAPESAGEGELVGSNFERKYRREGRPFHGLVLIRRAIETV
jgi:tRNA (guanine-N7-)-methyltransferase